MYGYLHPTYSAQEMLTTYRRGQSFGNPYGNVADLVVSTGGKVAGQASAEAAKAGAKADLIGTIATVAAMAFSAILGVTSQNSQAKKQRGHEKEMGAYNAQVAEINAKTAEANAIAQGEIAQASAKRTATMATYGLAGVALIGGLTFAGVMLLKKKG